MKRTRIRWRIWHRRLAWLVGIQLLLWSISGAYMVWLELDYIRGASHTNAKGQQQLLLEQAPKTIASSAQVLEQYTDVTALTLRRLPTEQWVYQVDRRYTTLLVDAVSLESFTLQQADIVALANDYRTSQSSIDDAPAVRLLTEQLPQEVNFAALPLWQVTYSDLLNTTLYIDPASGVLVSTRHDFWRLFDFMWMLHIMDYDERADISTWWAQALMLLSLVFILTGVSLLLLQLRRLGRRFHA
ncbi:hypothetical protein CWE22_09640 [Pseudidiomarina aestuarii]|uniref:PepSY domain-containing protein n=1 Tax=Pseudidiomarina aestuarii TaxID=624146 RepID=A0A7Z7ESY6_9GAMM|nr:hypothetical protein [Pseudidiomarina aestuarii]RUO39550.1 hypothetical protein CWE22_09640 [Pseudidiomarina aestuarii]